jgi:dTDP-L-rhamnose 4-epimerase
MLTVSASVGISAVALRFFSVYGQRQALSNPYTGVGAVFASALLNGHRPLILEDGHQIRDLIHVSDVVRACMRAIQHDRISSAVLSSSDPWRGADRARNRQPLSAV